MLKNLFKIFSGDADKNADFVTQQAVKNWKIFCESNPQIETFEWGRPHEVKLSEKNSGEFIIFLYSKISKRSCVLLFESEFCRRQFDKMLEKGSLPTYSWATHIDAYSPRIVGLENILERISVNIKIYENKF